MPDSQGAYKIERILKFGKMTKTTSNSNCGNSPKMEFIIPLDTVFAKGNVELLREGEVAEILRNR